MFWKKKDKGEAPEATAPPPKGKDKVETRREEPRREEPRREEPRREEPRREEPRREEPRRQEPQRAAAQQPQRAPEPQRAPAPQAPSPVGAKGSGASIDAALTARRGPRGAPATPESVAAQSHGADVLASSNDPVDRAAARDLAAGDIDRAFEALLGAAQVAGDNGADRWRTIGQLAFNIDAARSKLAYEQVHNFEPRRFWDCMFLARLRGIAQQRELAQQAAAGALAAATSDLERYIARTELGLIAVAMGDGPRAMEQAVAAGALAQAVGNGGLEVIRCDVLKGDAALLLKNPAAARAAYGDALAGAKKLGAASPKDVNAARGVCELLEKCAAAAAIGDDHDAAAKSIDEALNMRRRLTQALPPADARRDLAQTLSLKGELRSAANDVAGARAAYDECLSVIRQAADANPSDPAAQRELWGAMWRMATSSGGAVEWPRVVATMEKMQSAGALDQDGRRYLDEAKRRATA